jgi:hypothetical protein
MSPNSRLFHPTPAAAPPSSGIVLKNEGVVLGTITSLDVVGPDVDASIPAPGEGRITETSPPAAALTLKDHGTVLGTITELDVQGTDAVATLPAPNSGRITVPPPPPPTFGYFAGGYRAGFVNTANNDRLDFSNDVAAMLAKGALVAASDTVNGCNSSTNGYFTRDMTAQIDRLVFASDANPMVVANSGGQDGDCGATNSATKGYYAGGHRHTGAVTCKSLLFASDAAPLVVCGSLTVPRAFPGGVNSSTKGYYAGGLSLPTVYSSCDALTFATDAVAMLAAGALTSPRMTQGTANSTTFGYFSGGSQAAYGGASSVTNALSFASDATPMVAKGSLSIARVGLAGANSVTKGYFAGGANTWSSTTIWYATCDALTFASDAVAMMAVGALTVARTGNGACQSGGIL